MPQPERVFLDWSEATADGAARWLLSCREESKIFDFSNLLVLVPTRQAGRRLREALATHAAPRGVLSPVVLTPSQFLRPSDPDIAPPLEATMSFLAEFDRWGRDELPALFPHGIPFRTFDQRAGFARTFFLLRAALASSGLSIRTAAPRLTEHPDADRWTDLVAIERVYLAAIRRTGKRDRDEARIEAARNPALPELVREVAIIGVADLPTIVANALKILSEEITVRVVVPSEPGDDASFDVWGRPLPERWEDRDPGWEDFDRQVRLCARPADVAATLAAVMPRMEKPTGTFLELGLLDRSLAPQLRATVERAGGVFHDPDGERLSTHWLARLLAVLADFIGEPDYASATALLRDGAILGWLGTVLPDFDATEALAEADVLLASHFPTTAAEARERSAPGRSLRRALDHLLAFHAKTRKRRWLENVREFLGQVTGTIVPTLQAADREVLATALESLSPVLEQIAELEGRHSDVPVSDWLRLLQEALEEPRHYREREADAVDASGWLELPWSPAPQLVLAGFNQGVVPAPFASDPFLRQSVRLRLGLPTEADRDARDACFLARLLAMRRGGKGRVDVLVGQIDVEDAPQQPSPLLFAGAGQDLPGRVHRLFAEPHAPQADPPWEAGWKFDPEIVDLPPRIRVTGFANYLDCPFEFYLRFGLGMEPFDADPGEMDARIFGTLVHHTIEEFSNDSELRELTDAAAIGVALGELLDGFVARQFDVPLSLALIVQVESARQRLLAFARVQAMERRAGWRIEQVEVDFAGLLGRPWEVDGWEIRGKIDRIDRNERTGQWRVLDYKTSDRAEPPEKMHLRGGDRAKHVWPPDYALVGEGSGASGKWWVNLQLPLYRQLFVESGRVADEISCGYFNLPKAVSATGIAAWMDFDPVLAESAWHCVRGVLADLTRRHFWPPNVRARYPANAAWFQPGPERTVKLPGALSRATA